MHIKYNYYICYFSIIISKVKNTIILLNLKLGIKNIYDVRRVVPIGSMEVFSNKTDSGQSSLFFLLALPISNCTYEK